MVQNCPRCHESIRPKARYCARCGLFLEAAPGQALVAGRVCHPCPLAPPDGFEPVQEAADLFFRCESAWGGERLIGTESIGVILFNGGYPLAEVALKVCGQDEAGAELFAENHEVDALPRGKEVKIEVPSYELPAPTRRLAVCLISAEFGPDSQDPP